MDDIRVNLLVDELVTNFSSGKKNSHLWRRFADGTEDFCIRGRYYPILRRSLVVRDYENSQSPFILTFQDLPKVPTNKNADFQEDAILKDYLLMDLDGPDSNNKLRFAFSSDTHDNAYVVKWKHTSSFRHRIQPSWPSAFLAAALAMYAFLA